MLAWEMVLLGKKRRFLRLPVAFQRMWHLQHDPAIRKLARREPETQEEPYQTAHHFATSSQQLMVPHGQTQSQRPLKCSSRLSRLGWLGQRHVPLTLPVAAAALKVYQQPQSPSPSRILNPNADFEHASCLIREKWPSSPCYCRCYDLSSVPILTQDPPSEQY